MRSKPKITLHDYVTKDVPADVYESLAPLQVIESSSDEVIALVHDTEFDAYGVLDETTGHLVYGQSLDHAKRIFKQEILTHKNKTT